jgi:hypothetical protein
LHRGTGGRDIGVIEIDGGDKLSKHGSSLSTDGIDPNLNPVDTVLIKQGGVLGISSEGAEHGREGAKDGECG